MNGEGRSWRGLDDDDVLLSLLGRALHDGPQAPPADAVAVAKSAWNELDLDAELAALVADSALEEVGGRMRTAGTATEERTLVFEWADVRVEVVLLELDGQLLGRIEPPGPSGIELHSTDAPATTTSDELGRFRFALPRGRLRLRVRRDGAVGFVTPWITR